MWTNDVEGSNDMIRSLVCLLFPDVLVAWGLLFRCLKVRSEVGKQNFLPIRSQRLLENLFLKFKVKSQWRGGWRRLSVRGWSKMTSEVFREGILSKILIHSFFEHDWLSSDIENRKSCSHVCCCARALDLLYILSIFSFLWLECFHQQQQHSSAAFFNHDPASSWLPLHLCLSRLPFLPLCEFS